MTLAADPEIAGHAPTAPPPRSSRWKAITVVVAVGVVILAGAVSVAASASISQSAVAGVSVGYDAQPVVCDGTDVELKPSGENIQLLQLSIVLTEGMTCTLRVLVVNDGWSDVTLDSVTLEALGPGNLLGIEALFVNPNGPRGVAEPDDLGMRFEIDGEIIVPAGSTTTVTAAFRYDGGAELIACSAQGWNLPVIEVSSHGATRSVAPPPWSTIWFQAGSNEECGS